MDGPNRTATKANDLVYRLAVPPHRPARSVAWIIAASSFAFAVIQLDVTIVNVALFRISTDFGATVADLQWVVDAYTLGFAAMLLSAGVVADRWGSKRVFVAGLVGFAAASFACGLAPGPGFLNATRAIQGIGAALLVPSSLAILNDACATILAFAPGRVYHQHNGMKGNILPSILAGRLLRLSRWQRSSAR